MLEGAGLASFITLLDLVPRLAQKSKSSDKITLFQNIIIFSSVTTTLLHFFNINFKFSKLITIPIGLFLGAYVGLLAAALAETLNVIPILERRFKLKNYIYIPLIAISIGKVIGSLIGWLLIIK